MGNKKKQPRKSKLPKKRQGLTSEFYSNEKPANWGRFGKDAEKKQND